MAIAIAPSGATTTNERRDSVRTLIGRKTVQEIHDWVSSGPGRGWAEKVADRLAVSGYLTLADVTDDEFDHILGAAAHS